MDFFIAPHIFGDDFGDLDESGDEKEDEWDSPEAKQHISRKSTGNPLEIHWKSTGNPLEMGNRKREDVSGWFGTWLLFFHILGIVTPTD